MVEGAVMLPRRGCFEVSSVQPWEYIVHTVLKRVLNALKLENTTGGAYYYSTVITRAPTRLWLYTDPWLYRLHVTRLEG